MAPSTPSVFRCTVCGAEHVKWGGQCTSCGAWNALVEEPAGPAAGSPRRRTETAPRRLADVGGPGTVRWPTGLTELDYVLGGGIVPGSVTLVGLPNR